MLNQIGRLAQTTATNVSRRQFLGRVGDGALALAVAAGGLLATVGRADAGQKLCSSIYSLSQCQGRPLGSPCTDIQGRIGKCYSTERAIAPGIYACNGCRSGGKPPSDR